MEARGIDHCVSGTSAFYRAMSLMRQGKADEARKLATDTAAKMKPLPADERSALTVSHDDVVLWLAYKEARALIQFEPTTRPQAEPGKN
jgi:hypothetical protein